MLVFKSIKNLQEYISSFSADKTIGFVPTMGALHKGHLSLINSASLNNDFVVVSIFVNPTQFNKAEDLKKYPRTLEADISLLNKVKCDVVFAPTANEMYADKVESSSFNFDGLEHLMEGEFRAGHFDGVGTIVKKLFEIVNPTNAYFGEKDFQQLQIIKKMVAKNKLDVNVIGCKIFREDDGLAMSSRNTLLTSEQRKAAPLIYKTLKQVREKFETDCIEDCINWVKNEFKKQPILELEYFQIADEETLKQAPNNNSKKNYRAFIAVFADKIRLIDNIKL
ncbi:MAG: pantoate--beta-alanine ligase [Urechidicola sp.]|nr:pantoate--beta-alanine ligase [Urechidicola sp.]